MAHAFVMNVTLVLRGRSALAVCPRRILDEATHARGRLAALPDDRSFGALTRGCIGRCHRPYRTRSLAIPTPITLLQAAQVAPRRRTIMIATVVVIAIMVVVVVIAVTLVWTRA